MNEEDGIFVNESEVIEGQRKAAEAVGVNPDLVAPEDGSEPRKLMARRSCGQCWGRGTITFIPSPQRLKLFWVTKGPIGKFTKRTKTHFPNGKKRPKPLIPTRGPSKRENKVITGYSMERKDLLLAWDDRELAEKSEKRRGTSRPEPEGYKDSVAETRLCSCVREDKVA
jgi:hypothetical protein